MRSSVRAFAAMRSATSRLSSSSERMALEGEGEPEDRGEGRPEVVRRRPRSGPRPASSVAGLRSSAVALGDVEHEPADGARPSVLIDESCDRCRAAARSPRRRDRKRYSEVVLAGSRRLREERAEDRRRGPPGGDGLAQRSGLVDERPRRGSRGCGRRPLAHERRTGRTSQSDLPDDGIDVVHERLEASKVAARTARRHRPTWEKRGITRACYRAAAAPSARGSLPASSVPSSRISRRCA